MWSGTKTTNLVGATADGTDMSYVLTDAAVALIASGAALKAGFALLF